MKLYVSHASNFDYITELYEPLKVAFGNDHKLILPHDTDLNGVNTKDVLPTCDIVLAEVSFASTGQGIELGRAEAAHVPILCFYRPGATPSSSLRFLTDEINEYDTPQQLVEKLAEHLTRK